MKLAVVGCLDARVGRCQILQHGACFGLAICLAVSGRQILADDLVQSDKGDNMELETLARLLRSMEKGVYLRAANQLDALPGASVTFDLHLRQAGLDKAGAAELATALANLSSTSGPTLRSFSIS